MAKLTPSTTRLADAILDLEYGDEQERLRYYEAYAVIVHLQLIVLPIVAAIVVIASGASAIVPSLAVLAGVFGCLLFGKLHLERYHVRMELIAFSGRNRGYLVLYALAWALLIVALASASIGGSSFRNGFAIGAAIGAVVGVALLVIRARRHRHAADDLIADDSTTGEAGSRSS
ncbi:MAG: hypothetical protein QNJ75_05565 [Acidimicrobiia bacterium]|nr:hypothetical protein [Acidimicrobiia bacterium]